MAAAAAMMIMTMKSVVMVMMHDEREQPRQRTHERMNDEQPRHTARHLLTVER